MKKYLVLCLVLVGCSSSSPVSAPTIVPPAVAIVTKPPVTNIPTIGTAPLLLSTIITNTLTISTNILPNINTNNTIFIRTNGSFVVQWSYPYKDNIVFEIWETSQLTNNFALLSFTPSTNFNIKNSLPIYIRVRARNIKTGILSDWATTY